MKSHEEPACKDQQSHALPEPNTHQNRLVSMYSLGTFSILTKTVSIKKADLSVDGGLPRGHCLKSTLFPHAGS